MEVPGTRGIVELLLSSEIELLEVGGYRPISGPSNRPFASKTSKNPEIQPCRGAGTIADRSDGCKPRLRFIRALTGYYYQPGR